jgi:hypothetical protein
MNDRLVGVCLVVGIALGVLYGLLTVMAVVRVSRLARWQRAPGASPDDTSADVPRFVSRGEPFEESWQGSEGYARPDAPAENWVDRLIVSVVTPLRPSRFNDRTYWRSALPFVVVTRFVLFVGVPVCRRRSAHSHTTTVVRGVLYANAEPTIRNPSRFDGEHIGCLPSWDRHADANFVEPTLTLNYRCQREQGRRHLLSPRRS